VRYFLLFIVLQLLYFSSRADYWNADFRLPRLKGVRKVLVKETRWIYPQGKPPVAQVSRSVLWINKDGLVVTEDNYDKYSWITSRNYYEYIGDDTAIAAIKIFVYPNLFPWHKPTRKDSLVQTVEFVDDHHDARRSAWLYYHIDSLKARRLLNSTATFYDANCKMVYSLYKRFDNGGATDSTVYQYKGDTLIALEYTNQGSERGTYQLRRSTATVQRYDTAGRLIYADRLADNYSGTLRRSEFIYRPDGLYEGERYVQQCEGCKSGWLQGGDKRTYDAQSRLRSLEHYVDGRPELRYDLEYVK